MGLAGLYLLLFSIEKSGTVIFQILEEKKPTMVISIFNMFYLNLKQTKNF